MSKLSSDAIEIIIPGAVVYTAFSQLTLILPYLSF
jgi:hypothetical protein